MTDSKKVMEGTLLLNAWALMHSIKALHKILFMKHLLNLIISKIMISLYGQLRRETDFCNKSWPIFRSNTLNKRKQSKKLYILKNGKIDLIANNQAVMLINTWSY